MKKILLLLSSIVMIGFFSIQETYPRTKDGGHPVEDTAFLLESMDKLDASLEKALWEAIAWRQNARSEREWLSGAKELEEAFGLPAKAPFLRSNRNWEYVQVRPLERNGRLSLRYLGIPGENGAYQARLILKLESTASDSLHLHEFANSRKKLNELGYRVTFFSCLTGSTDDTLETVRNRLVRAIGGRDGQLVEEYGDGATYVYRLSGSHPLQIQLHWNGTRQKTEVTLGTPLIITEY